MSHRVTVDTEMTDRDLAIDALKAAKFRYTESGSTLTINNGGGRADATINLKTGKITGDSDFHSKDGLGILRQHYAEAKFRKAASDQGISINSRSVDEEGNVILTCRTA